MSELDTIDRQFLFVALTTPCALRSLWAVATGGGGRVVSLHFITQVQARFVWQRPRLAQVHHIRKCRSVGRLPRSDPQQLIWLHKRHLVSEKTKRDITGTLDVQCFLTPVHQPPPPPETGVIYAANLRKFH
jgi:hypothetical protein